MPLVRLLTLAALLALGAAVAYRTWEAPAGGEPATAAPAGALPADGYERIQLGMAEGEVEAVLGGKPDQTATGFGGPWGALSRSKRWPCDDGELWVRFGYDGRVVGKSFLNKLSLQQ